MPPSALSCCAEVMCSDHPGPFQPDTGIISAHATPQAWLTAAVRSTSFRLLRMKQASPLSILQTESGDPINSMGKQSCRASACTRTLAAPPRPPRRVAHPHASGLTLLGTLLCSVAGPASLGMCSVSLCSLGSHEILVLQRRALEVNHSLRPQRDLQDTPHLDVHLCWAKYHHVVILQERGWRGSGGWWSHSCWPRRAATPGFAA